MPILHLVGSEKVKPKRWKLIVSVIIFVLVWIPFGFKWYTYVHSPEYAAKEFVKALTTGDEKLLDHLNYTDKHEQTIKQDFGDIFKDSSFKDFYYKPGDTPDIIRAYSNKSSKYLSLYEIKLNNEWYIGHYFVSSQ